jgi:hypothetical protein
MYKVYSAENEHTQGHLEGEYETMRQALDAAQKGCDEDGRLWWVDAYGSKTTIKGINVI